MRGCTCHVGLHTTYGGLLHVLLRAVSEAAKDVGCDSSLGRFFFGLHDLSSVLRARYHGFHSIFGHHCVLYLMHMHLINDTVYQEGSMRLAIKHRLLCPLNSKVHLILATCKLNSVDLRSISRFALICTFLYVYLDPYQLSGAPCC